MIKIHEAWTHREWRQSESKVNHMVILTIDHCSTRCFIRSSRDSWHRVQVKCSESERKADSIVLVDKSGLASHARYAEARAHALVNFFCSVKSQNGVGE